MLSSVLLPETLKHPPSNDEFYPVYYDNVIYDCFNLKVSYYNHIKIKKNIVKLNKGYIQS